MTNGYAEKIEYKIADNVKLRNETYLLTSKRQWRNSESYTYVPATGLVNRSGYLEILHDLKQSGNRFDATVDGAIAGMQNRFTAGYVGERTANNANTLTIPGYTTVDALLRCKISRDSNLALSVSNLANKVYAMSAANGGSQGLLGSPRTVILTARAKF